MAKDDVMTRDIRNTIKKAFGNAGRYGKGVGRLFLATGDEFIKAQMPAPVAMFETNRDILTEFWRALRNPAEATNRYGARIAETQTYKSLKKFAGNALDDLKTGNFYDPNRDRTEFGMEADELMNSFGGFDMTGFDENGDWSEDLADNSDFDKEIKLAEAQEAGASRRTEATIEGISKGTEAIVMNQQAIASNDLRVSMKQHSQIMNGMQNMITQQVASNELQAKSINALLDVTREAHKQTMEQMNQINETLAQIRDFVKPKEEYKRREYRPGMEMFGINGELDIRNFFKNAFKNATDKMTMGGGLGMLTGGFSVSDLLEMFGENPLHMIASFGLPALVPKNVKAQMQRTNKNMSSFFPALLTKAADRGRKFENGESKDIRDMIAGFFGVNQKSSSYLTTQRDDFMRAAKFTDKTVRAIEEVIPALLSKIDSSISGQPMKLFDYKSGKFVRADATVAKFDRDAYDLVGRSGDTSYKIMGRARAMRHKTREDAEDFQQFVHDYLQGVAERGDFINPTISAEEFDKTLPSIANANSIGGKGPAARRELYGKYLRSILLGMDRSDLQEISKNLLEARATRDRSTFNLNRSLEDTGLGAAFSGLLDEQLQSTIKSKARSSYSGLSEDDLDKLSENRKKAIIKAGGSKATNMILQDILNTLQRGIITYPYNMGFMSNKNAITGSVNMSDQAKKAFSALESSQKIDDDLKKKKDKERQDKESRYKYDLDVYQKNIMKANRELGDLYVEDLDENTIRLIQESITDKEMDPNDPLIIEKKKREEKYKNYKDVADNYIGKAKSKFGKFGSKPLKLRDAIQGALRAPFNLFTKGMRIADTAMLRALYGEDIDNYELWKDEEGEPYLFGTLSKAIKTHFTNAKNWFAKNIGTPLKNFLLNEDTGLLPRFAKAFDNMFGISEKRDRAKDKSKRLLKKLDEKVRGVKIGGEYQGGLLSKPLNEFSRIKYESKDSITGGIKMAFEKLMYGDMAHSKGAGNYRIETKGGSTQAVYYKKKQYSGIIGQFKRGFDAIGKVLFGEDNTSDNPTDSKKKFDLVVGEFKSAFPSIAIGAGLGAITSIFLPGGPLLGSLLGAGLGLVKGSEKLKEFLFGEADEVQMTDKNGLPMYDKNGTPITKKTRKGGIVNKEIYDGFKKYAPKMAIGAGVGALASIFLPGGPLIGGLIGSIGGMTAASDKMKELIFGKQDDKDSGLISKNFREKAGKWMKTHLPAAMGGALAGGAAWGLISNIGLIPGLSLLPGGPILGFIGASMGLANADKINKFFFGEEVETDEVDKDGKPTGKKVKEKKGGVFNKVFDTIKDKAVTPLAKQLNFVGGKIADWFKDSVLGPFSRAIDPMKEAIGDAGKRIKDSMTRIGDSITDALFGKKDDPDAPRNVFKKTFKEKFIEPLKKLSDKIFGFIGKLIGNIISAPFKALEFIFNGTIDGKDPAERRNEKREGRWDKRREKTRERRKQRAEKFGSLRDKLKGMFGKIKDTIEDDFTLFSPEEYKEYQRTGKIPDRFSESFKRRHGGGTTPTNNIPSGAPIAAGSADEEFSYARYESEVGRTRATPDGYNKWYKKKLDDKNREEKRNNRWWRRGRNKKKDDDKTKDSKDKNDSQTDKAEESKEKEDKDDRNAKANNDDIIKRGRRRKSEKDYLHNIEKYTRRINGKLSDNINGVGWNIAYITTLLKKQFGELSPEELPEEMEGSKKVKKRKTLVGRVLGGAKDWLGEKFGGIGGKIKSFGSTALDIVLRPFEFLGNAIHGVGEALKGFGSLLSTALKETFQTVGVVIRESVTTLGVAIKNMLPVVGKALTGVVGMLKDTLLVFTGVLREGIVATASLVRGAFEIAADIVPDIVHGAWTVMKGAGKGLFKAGKAVGRGIFRGVKGIGGAIGRKITGKSGKNVITKTHSFRLDGGFLDNIENPVPISIGGFGNEQPFPVVKLLRGKPVGYIPSAIPVYVVGQRDQFNPYRGFGNAPYGYGPGPSGPGTGPVHGDNVGFNFRGAITAAANANHTADNIVDVQWAPVGSNLALPPGKTNIDDEYLDSYKTINTLVASSKNPDVTFDRIVANAQTPTTIKAALDVKALNGERLALGPGTAQEEKKNGMLDWLKTLLGGAGIGGILATIAGLVGAGVLGITGIKDGDPGKVIRGAEVIAQGALKKFGLTQFRDKTIQTLGKDGVRTGTQHKITGTVFKDILKGEVSARGMAERASLDSGVQAATRSGSKTAKMLGRQAKGFNSLAKFADFTAGIKAGFKGADTEALERILMNDPDGKMGFFAKKGVKARMGLGNAVGKGAKNLGSLAAKGIDNVLKGFEKLSILSKYAGKLNVKGLLNAVKTFLKGPVLKKAEQVGLKQLGEAAAKQLAMFSVPAVATLGFAVVDFISGWNNAYKYFGVFSDQVTLGMKLTSAVVNVLEGLILLIPGAGIPLSIALTFFTDKLVEVAYKAVASKDAANELDEKQKELQEQTDTYNKANNTDLTTDQYAKEFNSDGQKKKTPWQIFKTFMLGNDSTKSAANVTNKSSSMRYSTDGTLVGKGRGLDESSWGAGGKIKAMSQHSSAFNKNNRVMADAGCGPTAGAMVASAYGVKLNPEQLSRDSFGSGMRAPDGGTNPAYFSQMAGKFGSGFGMAQGPVSGARISSNLSAGQPVIMMGKGGPYGPTSHYMVAEGMTGKGGVRMIDPNNGSRKTVGMGNLLKNSTASVYSWGRGRDHRAGWGRGGDVSETNNFKNDLDSQSLLDDDYNTPTGKLIAFGGGRGLSWGKGGVIANMATSIGSSAIGSSQAKSMIQSLMGEYITRHWTRTDSSGYGAWRTSYGGRYHAGIDLCFASNTTTGRAIKSFTSGTVYRVHNNSGGRGWYIIIKDNNGYYHFYQHLNKSPTLAVGSTVRIGDVVGGYGNTGASNGNHLHYEVRPPTVVNQPGGITGTDPGNNGFIRSKGELARYTVNPYTYLQQYMNGKIDPSQLGDGSGTTTGGTTTDSSGTEGTVNSNDPKGIRVLSGISDAFTKAASPFENLINKIMNNKEEAAADESATTTGTDGVPSVSGEQGSKEANAKYIYKFLKAINVPNDHIAAVLSNWTAESDIDPTGVETIYAPKYQMSQEKLNAMADPNSFSLNVMFPKYARSGISLHKEAYKGDDGKYYPGIGLGGFTGPAVSGLLRKANEIGKPWYDLETQLRYFSDPSGSVYTRGKYGGRDWINNVFIPQKFSSPSQGAAWFEKNWEGSTFKQAEHMRTAQEWFNKIESGVWDKANGGVAGTAASVDQSAVDAAANVLNTVAGNGIGTDIYGEYGKGDPSANVKSIAAKARQYSEAFANYNKATNANSLTSVANSIRAAKPDDTTAQILAFLTENIGTLIAYVSKIADKMPEKQEPQKVSEVKENISKAKSTAKIPTARTSNIYNATPTGGDPVDVGMKIINSLTSK